TTAARSFSSPALSDRDPTLRDVLLDLEVGGMAGGARRLGGAASGSRPPPAQAPSHRRAARSPCRPPSRDLRDTGGRKRIRALGTGLRDRLRTAWNPVRRRDRVERKARRADPARRRARPGRARSRRALLRSDRFLGAAGRDPAIAGR